jgi:hypothetical protein
MATLEVEVHHAPDDLEYGGAAALSHNINPLEQAVDEARRMVCALGGEMRRRSEGELPRWLQAQTPSNVARAISAGV